MEQLSGEQYPLPVNESVNLQVSVSVTGDSHTYSGRRGETLLDILLDGGLVVEHECGGNCSCTTCHVTIIEGEYNLSPIEWPEEDRLSTLSQRNVFSRLSCQALVLRGIVTIELR